MTQKAIETVAEILTKSGIYAQPRFIASAQSELADDVAALTEAVGSQVRVTQSGFSRPEYVFFTEKGLTLAVARLEQKIEEVTAELAKLRMSLQSVEQIRDSLRP